MKHWLTKLFIDNWVRKLISFIFAIIIWFLVDQSLTSQRTLTSVGVHIMNLPEGKTIEGIQTSGLLKERQTIKIDGRKSHIDELSSSDIELRVDARDLRGRTSVKLTRKNLSSLNHDLNISHHISKMTEKNLSLNIVPLAKETIPVYVTQPIGEPPKGYQFLDVWPYHLDLNVHGPENVIKRLKNRGTKLTFNLNNVKKSQLDNLTIGNSKDVISYYVPNEWKSLYIPDLSEDPVEIDDPDSKYLRIDFIRSDVIPVTFSIPINIFVSPKHKSKINPNSFYLTHDCSFIKPKHGQKVLQGGLYTKGVSKVFVDIIKGMLSLSINLVPGSTDESVNWSLQIINPTLLEDRYVSTLMKDPTDDTKYMHPGMRQEYLRNRFRHYLNRFKLYTENEQPFDIKVELKGKEVIVKADLLE